MTARTDLDALDAIVTRMTPGELSPFGSRYSAFADAGESVLTCETTDDRDGFVALRNAAPDLIAELRALRAYKARREQERCETCERFAIETEPDGTVTESCSYHMQFFCRDGGGNEGYARGWSRNWHCFDWRGRDET